MSLRIHIQVVGMTHSHINVVEDTDSQGRWKCWEKVCLLYVSGTH